LEGHPVSTFKAGSSQRRVNVNQAADIYIYNFYCRNVKKIDVLHAETVTYDPYPNLHKKGKSNLDRPSNVANQESKPLDKEG
jgi:hypothetical protein